MYHKYKNIGALQHSGGKQRDGIFSDKGAYPFSFKLTNAQASLAGIKSICIQRTLH